MCLFISDLAFDDELQFATAKIGILAASIASALVGRRRARTVVAEGPASSRTQL